MVKSLETGSSSGIPWVGPIYSHKSLKVEREAESGSGRGQSQRLKMPRPAIGGSEGRGRGPWAKQNEGL